VRRFRAAIVLGSALGALGALGTSCGPGAVTGAVDIRFAAAGNRPEAATVRVVGIPARHVPRPADVAAGQWTSALRVTVVPDATDPSSELPDVPAVLGSYTVERTAIVFKPRFGFDPGRRYRVVFDASKLPGTDGWRPDPVVAIVGLPKRELLETTVVSHVYPSADVVPENQLRLYIHFSAPMGLKGGIDDVRLLDDAGRDVEDPFLPLDAEFWNRDRTRFTVFFDPGRQKRGILPNEQMGRSLIEGRAYTLVVSREWRDAQGMPLKEEFRRRFTAGAPDERALDQKTWTIGAPRRDTRDPLIVAFPEPLDHGLLLRALGVVDGSGRPIDGERRVEAGETRWAFIPGEPWRQGAYYLIALTILEDLAGNRIGRAFEVDEFTRADESAEEERVSVPFSVM
jgi:hypothetical protein